MVCHRRENTPPHRLDYSGCECAPSGTSGARSCEITPRTEVFNQSEITPLGLFRRPSTCANAGFVKNGACPVNISCSTGAQTFRPDLDPNSLRHFLTRRDRVFAQTLLVRHRLLATHRDTNRSALQKALLAHDVPWPGESPRYTTVNGVKRYLLDQNKPQAFSQFLRRSRMSLPAFVRLLRGETLADPRPNKALEITDHLPGWATYSYKHEWEAIVRHGVTPRWNRPFGTQQNAPANHPSARTALNMLVKGIRKGQDDSRYLVVDLELLEFLEGVTCSPFGAVPKGAHDISVDARIIHDLSHPPGESINDHAVEDDTIPVRYSGAATLARRILDVETEAPGSAEMMTGDVHGAFRNIPIAAEAVGRFSGTIPELQGLVIDLSCPFGWTDSPGHYWTAGAAINHIHASSRPQWCDQPLKGSQFFDDKAWCDDHICIEPNVDSRRAEANLSLRSAMTAVLGPEACNEETFSAWFRVGTALGLEWNLDSMTIAVPAEKLDKARERLQAMLQATTTTRRTLNKLVGSLRHVSTIIIPAKPFFQRIADLARLTHRFAATNVSESVRDDIRWFLTILRLNRLNRVPMIRFTQQQVPQVHIYMDASDHGLCALFPDRREYLQVEFTAEEREEIEQFNVTGADGFGINLRELMSTGFAAIAWSEAWAGSSTAALRHVRFWIDNTTAVAWNNRKASRNPRAQMLLRLLALFEVRFDFFTSADHIPGIDTEQLERSLFALGALLRAGALADTSRGLYQRNWNQWVKWWGLMRYQPWLQKDAVDVNASQLGAYAVFLWRFGINKSGKGNTYSTICGKLCAVRWYHRNAAGYDPGVNASHAILLRGIRRFTSPVIKQHPVFPTLLRHIYHSMDLRQPRGQLLWGGVLLGYFFLLRRSEYLYIGNKCHGYILRLSDIKMLGADQKAASPRRAVLVGIRLSGAKNNQYGRQEERFHSRSGDPILCPAKGARWVLKAAAAFHTRSSQPALSTGNGCGITSREVASLLKTAASELGLEGERFSTHSIRIGGATALLNGGADRLVLKLMGRWLSNAFEPYPVLTAESSSHLSSMMC